MKIVNKAKLKSNVSVEIPATSIYDIAINDILGKLISFLGIINF